MANFYRPGTSNGPTEEINARFEHLRGTTLEVHNLTNYITRATTGRRRIHPSYTLISDEPHIL